MSLYFITIKRGENQRFSNERSAGFQWFGSGTLPNQGIKCIKVPYVFYKFNRLLYFCYVPLDLFR
jgi:hypothetical protein